MKTPANIPTADTQAVDTYESVAQTPAGRRRGRAARLLHRVLLSVGDGVVAAPDLDQGKALCWS